MKKMNVCTLLFLSAALICCGGGGSDKSTQEPEPVVALPDTTPNDFSIASQTHLERGASVVSDTVVVTGIDTEVEVTTQGCRVSVNEGEFTAHPVLVSDGASLIFEVTASDAYGEEALCQIQAGAFSTQFSVATKPLLASAKFFRYTSFGAERGHVNISRLFTHNVDGSFAKEVTNFEGNAVHFVDSKPEAYTAVFEIEAIGDTVLAIYTSENIEVGVEVDLLDFFPYIEEDLVKENECREIQLDVSGLDLDLDTYRVAVAGSELCSASVTYPKVEGGQLTLRVEGKAEHDQQLIFYVYGIGDNVIGYEIIDLNRLEQSSVVNIESLKNDFISMPVTSVSDKQITVDVTVSIDSNPTQYYRVGGRDIDALGDVNIDLIPLSGDRYVIGTSVGDVSLDREGYQWSAGWTTVKDELPSRHIVDVYGRVTEFQVDYDESLFVRWYGTRLDLYDRSSIILEGSTTLFDGYVWRLDKKNPREDTIAPFSFLDEYDLDFTFPEVSLYLFNDDEETGFKSRINISTWGHYFCNDHPCGWINKFEE